MTRIDVPGAAGAWTGPGAPAWTAAELAALIHGTVVAGRPDVRGVGLTTDSRVVPPASVFVGIPGERFDGGSFAPAVLAGGAAIVVVTPEWVSVAAGACGPDQAVVALDDRFSQPSDLKLVPGSPSPRSPLAYRALAALALAHRRQMPARVVAVTGSNGKTTTKEMLSAALAGAGPVLCTQGNLNNEIGAPLTLLGLRPHHRFAVVEIGMNHAGEISRLSRACDPDVGVVTLAGSAHIEMLGSVEGVSRAKGELYLALDAGSVAVANADDPFMTVRAQEAGRRTVWFGRHPRADVCLESIDAHDRQGIRASVRVDGRRYAMRLPVVGLHNALNACAALAAGWALGGDVPLLLEGLAQARPPGRRLRLSDLPGVAAPGATLIDDCYNANPDSMTAALDTVAALVPESGLRCAVLGDMRELGAGAAADHQACGIHAARTGLGLLVCFGAHGPDLAAGARSGGMPAERIVVTESPDDAARAVREWLRPGAAVLVKASRGTRLERVSDLLVPPSSLSLNGQH